MAPRRYIAVIQDPRGYPGPGDPLDPAPPEGPAQPVLHSVVLADDYDKLRDALDEIAFRATVERSPDGVDQAAVAMQLIAREALGKVDAYPLGDRVNDPALNQTEGTP